MKPHRRKFPPPMGAGYAHLGSIVGENELFRDRPLPPPVGRFVGGGYIPPEADEEEVVRLLEAARQQPPADSTPGN